MCARGERAVSPLGHLVCLEGCPEPAPMLADAEVARVAGLISAADADRLRRVA